MCELGAPLKKIWVELVPITGQISQIHGITPQTQSHERLSRPPTDLGYAANKWECSFIGQSQLQLFEKKKKKKVKTGSLSSLSRASNHTYTHTHTLIILTLFHYCSSSWLVCSYCCTCLYSIPLYHTIFQLYWILKVWLFSLSLWDYIFISFHLLFFHPISFSFSLLILTASINLAKFPCLCLSQFGIFFFLCAHHSVYYYLLFALKSVQVHIVQEKKKNITFDAILKYCTNASFQISFNPLCPKT